MSDKRIETWRVESEDGEIEELTITYAHYYWQGECKGTLGNVAGWPRAAAAKVAAKCHMSVVSILAPGEPTRAEALAAERERLAALLRDHADDRVNDAPEYAEAIYDAEALVRGERPVYAPRATTKDLLARARAGVNSAYAAIAPDRAASLPPDADLGNLAELVSLEVREYVRRMEKPAAMIDAANEAATRIIRECTALRASLASAWADGARAMRDAAVAAVKRRAEALDASVTEEEATDDEDGYGRFQEALELAETLAALPIPEATNTETK